MFLNKGTCLIKLQSLKEAKETLDKAIKLNPQYSKAYLRRGEASLALEDFIAAKLDFQKVETLGTEVKVDLDKKRKAEEFSKVQEEKMKEEMLGKLKDLGNSVLGNFGMSLDNFKVQ